jgi:hypothetical protein
MDMIEDRTGLTTTAFILLAIAMRGNKIDMKRAAASVGNMADYPDMIQRYWEDANVISNIVFDITGFQNDDSDLEIPSE